MTGLDRGGAATAAGYRVRPVEPEDAQALGEVHVQVWHEAYAGVFSQDHLDGLDPVEFTARWRAWTLDPAAQLRTLRVALAPSGRVVGFAIAGPSRDLDAPVADELYAINLLAAHHGSGVADLLLAAVLPGPKPASLWVVAANERARRFYTRHGFAPQDPPALKTDHDADVPEIRLIRR